MDLMVKVAAGAITAAVLGVVLRKNTPELALLLALAAGLWMVALVADGLGAVVKTVALSILTRLTAEVCKSAGEGGVAAFVETAGTVLALVVALPLVRAVVLMMTEMLK